MKKSAFLIFLSIIVVLFANCTRRYVVEEPTFIEQAQPAQPSNRHVWVNGDWSWNNQKKSYLRRGGYWTVPNQGRRYIQGHWNTSRKGKYWVKGRWR